MSGSKDHPERICVFCGSSAGRIPEYAKSAQVFARLMAEQGIGIVYGGSSLGMMGALADSALQSGGSVIGVIPRGILGREIAHPGLSELHIVESMHSRKAMMAELSDAFVALPGGVGTLEEFFEVWTWAQLGIHDKPVGLLNTSGYFDSLIRYLKWAVEEQFVRPADLGMVIIESEPEALLREVLRSRPGPVTE